MLLLQVEEQRLTQAQSAAAETPVVSSGSEKGKVKKEAGTPLPTQNGEGDSLSINSGILQVSPGRAVKNPSAGMEVKA